MKQKPLTEKQHEIIKRLERVLREAKEASIKFVCDVADCSLTAFNGENVIDYYNYYGEPSNENAEKMEWDSAHIVKNVDVETVNSNIDDLLLEFEE